MIRYPQMRNVALALLIPATLAIISCAKPDPGFKVEFTIKDLMDSVVDSNADYLWESVETVSSAAGIVEKAPKTDEEWKEARRHAIALMEATNLLRIPGRKVAKPGEKAEDPRVEMPPESIQTLIDSDRQAWGTAAQRLYDATSKALKAIEAKNADGLLESGDGIDQACESCHLKYWYPKSYELEQKNRPNASEKSK